MEEPSHSPGEIENAEIKKSSVAGPIFLTLFTLAIIGGLVYLPFYAEKEPLIGILNSDAWWVPNVGEYHPLVLHLPIGIVFLTLVMEVCSWLSFGRYRPMTGLALFLAFVMGAFSCATGLFDLKVEGVAHNDWSDDMFKHMWLGIIFVGILGLAFLAKIWGRHSGSRGPVYGILLFGAAGVLAYGAHFGGLETHKVDPIEITLKGFELIGGEDKQSDNGDPVSVTKLPKDRLAYKEVVYPIMETKCLDCHSEEAGKSKGGLYLDTYENFLVGGDGIDEEPPRFTLVPGDSKKSFMIVALHLPMDDDYHMPPEKKKQMEPHEIELLTWWVENLPVRKDDKDFTLVDQTLGEMGAPQNILDAAAKMVSPEELKAIAAKIEAEKAAVDKARLEKREALQVSLDILRQDPNFKTSLGYASQDSTDLEFTAVSLRKKLNDETFAKLALVAESLTTLKLGSSSVTEAAVLEYLPAMKNLTKLDLSQTEVGDGIMDAVVTLEKLEYLNLYGTQVTDAGIMRLKTLGGLRDLYLWQSKATPEGGEALKKELPGLEITFGVN